MQYGFSRVFTIVRTSDSGEQRFKEPIVNELVLTVFGLSVVVACVYFGCGSGCEVVVYCQCTYSVASVLAVCAAVVLSWWFSNLSY